MSMNQNQIPAGWESLPLAVRDAVLAELQAKYLADGPVSRLPELLVAERSEYMPASLEQQYIWQRQQANAYTLGWATAVPAMLFEAVDMAALESALWSLQSQHGSLRTRLVVKDEALYQCVDDRQPLPLREQKLPRWRGRAATITEIGRRQRTLVEERFELASGPLWRALVLRRGKDAVLLMSFCSVIFDGGSLALVQQQLYALYQHAKDATPLPEELQKAPLQYRDYAQWQQQLRGHELWRERLHWWQENLKGAVPAVEGEGSAPAELSTRLYEQTLSKATCAQLDDYAQSNETTPFVVMLTEFMATLHELDSHDDIWVAAPSANRPLAGTETMIGNFMRQVLLRQQWPEQQDDRLAAVHTTVSEALEHGDLPHQLIAEMLPQEAGAGNPYRYFFNYRHAEAQGEEADDMDIEFAVEPEQMLVNREEQILLMVLESENSRQIHWYLRESRFDAARAETLLKRYFARLKLRIGA